MNLRNAILCALVTTAGSSAPAGVFTWTGGHLGNWNDPANWAGPGGLHPRLTVDTAILSGNSNSANLMANTALGQLSILNGASVYSSGHSLFADGNVFLGPGSSLSVSDTPVQRDFDADTLTLAGGTLAMYGGLAQIDESLVIGSPSGGAILGVGTVEMDSTTGNLEIGNGGIWAISGGGPETTLLIDRTDTSTSRLDWTDSESAIIAWEGKTIHNKLPYTAPLGGRIVVDNGGPSVFTSDHGFIAGPSSRILFSGVDQDHTARIEAPFVDSYGEFNVSGKGWLDSPFVALRGSGEIGENDEIAISSAAMLWDSFVFTANGPGAEVDFPRVHSAVSVTGGATVFDLGEDGAFDLDGGGAMEITIAGGSSLEILAGKIDTVPTEGFEGTLDIAGALHIEAYNDDRWFNRGAINMEDGEFTGRSIQNRGTVQGEGFIDTHVVNEGLIEAIGSTLVFADLDFDGFLGTPARGVVRAEQGDLVVMSPPSGFTRTIFGTISVGNGSSPQKVLEYNSDIVLLSDSESSGSLSLNNGFARFGSLRTVTEFESTGDSVLVMSGESPFGFFLDDGTASIDGTLEVRGGILITGDVQMLGNGTIDMSMTSKRLRLLDGANTEGVAIAASGEILISDSFLGPGPGRATTAGLTMRPTARLEINIEDTAASNGFSQLIVTGDAELDGTLAVRWSADQGDAPVGETYTVLSADSVEGSFDAVDFSDLGVNRRAHVTVSPDSVEVLVTCLTDLNADGVLDLGDITEFVDAFTGGDLLADVAPPQGVLDLSDIAAFVSFFQGGCS